MKYIIYLTILIGLYLSISNVYAHTDLRVEDVTISIGWLNEPPLVGEFNYIFLKFVKNDKPFVVDTSLLKTSIKYGGVAKDLELEPLANIGEYGAKIIPTRTGSYVVILKGSIDGKQVDAEFPIEDVEDKNRLNFPTESNSAELSIITKQLQSSLNQLQLNIDKSARQAEEVKKVAQDTLDIVNNMQQDFDKVYSIGMLGMGLGAAGVIIGVIAMIKKPKEY